MSQVVDDLKSVNGAIQEVTESAEGLNESLRGVPRVVADAAGAMDRLRAKQAKQAQDIQKALHDLGSLQFDLTTNSEIPGNALRTNTQFPRDDRFTTNKSGGGGGGGGSRGPSGKDGDPVNCRIPGTEDAINNQTQLIGGWLRAMFEQQERRSSPGQYIGKNLPRPANNGGG